MSRFYTYLNRNEYAMSREDDYAQTASVRRFIETGAATETELFRMGINASEPFRTITFTDDPEELEALASQSTRTAYWVAYADGKIIHKQDAANGGYIAARNALNGYIATQRIMFGREAQTPALDKVSSYHLADTTPAPLSSPCGNLKADPYEDRIPAAVSWYEGEKEETDHLPYLEGTTEAAALGNARAVNSYAACE